MQKTERESEIKHGDKYGYDIFTGDDCARFDPPVDGDEVLRNDSTWRRICLSEYMQFFQNCTYRRRVQLGNAVGATPKWRLVAWNERVADGDEGMQDDGTWVEFTASVRNYEKVSEWFTKTSLPYRAIRRRVAAAPVAAPEPRCESRFVGAKHGRGIVQCELVYGHTGMHRNKDTEWTTLAAIPFTPVTATDVDAPKPGDTVGVVGKEEVWRRLFGGFLAGGCAEAACRAVATASGEWVDVAKESPPKTDTVYAQIGDGRCMWVDGTWVAGAVLKEYGAVRWFKMPPIPPPPPVANPDEVAMEEAMSVASRASAILSATADCLSRREQRIFSGAWFAALDYARKEAAK